MFNHTLADQKNFTPLLYHKSCHAGVLAKSLLSSLARRVISPGHLYASPHQTTLWHKVHLQHAPTRKTGLKKTIYHQIPECLSPLIHKKKVSLLSLGCGDGLKDALLLKGMHRMGVSEISYQPADVSASLVDIAYRRVQKTIQTKMLPGAICDLEDKDVISDLSSSWADAPQKIVLLYGINPNFAQAPFFRMISKILLHSDLVILSANLYPGQDKAIGMKKIFPQYRNKETHAWLMGFIHSLGLKKQDGQIEFSIQIPGLENSPPYICADYRFSRRTNLCLHERDFHFSKNDTLRLFNSYRHSRLSIDALCHSHGLCVMERLITENEQEGIFIIKKRINR